MHKNINIIVAAALIDKNMNILLAKRKSPKQFENYWEFPGGKIEENESPIEALIRECNEELDIIIPKECFSPFTFCEWERDENKYILLLYVTRKWKGTPKPIVAKEIEFVPIIDIFSKKLLPNDLQIAAMLRDYFAAS